MHTLYVVSDQLQTTRAALGEAHGRLLTALDGDADPPPPLARAVAFFRAQSSRPNLPLGR